VAGCVEARAHRLRAVLPAFSAQLAPAAPFFPRRQTLRARQSELWAPGKWLPVVLALHRLQLSQRLQLDDVADIPPGLDLARRRRRKRSSRSMSQHAPSPTAFGVCTAHTAHAACRARCTFSTHVHKHGRAAAPQLQALRRRAAAAGQPVAGQDAHEREAWEKPCYDERACSPHACPATVSTVVKT